VQDADREEWCLLEPVPTGEDDEEEDEEGDDEEKDGEAEEVCLSAHACQSVAVCVSVSDWLCQSVTVRVACV
jgi:hypothetical protein